MVLLAQEMKTDRRPISQVLRRVIKSRSRRTLFRGKLEIVNALHRLLRVWPSELFEIVLRKGPSLYVFKVPINSYLLCYRETF